MIKEEYKYDPDNDRLYIKRTQDVEPILEANKIQYNNADKHFKSEAFNHVARIPLILLEKWSRDHGIKFEEVMNNEAVMKRFLNDPSNKFLRTKPGKI